MMRWRSLENWQMQTGVIIIVATLLAIVIAMTTASVSMGQLDQGVRAQVIPYSVERDDIAAASVNLAFGFTARTVAIEATTTNTAVIAIDWVGGTAVCPAVNTPGDARFPIGRIIIKDDADIASISVIACSGTQGVNVTAWQ